MSSGSRCRSISCAIGSRRRMRSPYDSPRGYRYVNLSAARRRLLRVLVLDLLGSSRRRCWRRSRRGCGRHWAHLHPLGAVGAADHRRRDVARRPDRPLQRRRPQPAQRACHWRRRGGRASPTRRARVLLAGGEPESPPILPISLYSDWPWRESRAARAPCARSSGRRRRASAGIRGSVHPDLVRRRRGGSAQVLLPFRATRTRARTARSARESRGAPPVDRIVLHADLLAQDVRLDDAVARIVR